MGLAGGAELLLHTEVDLGVAAPEPATATRPEVIRLRHLLEADELAVEAASVVLAARRHGELDVVEPEDARH
jgi:hypothetical protein